MHVVAVVALVGRVGGQFALLDLVRPRLAGRVVKLEAVALQHDVVAIVEVDEAVGDRQQGGDVGGDEVFADADADDQRRPAAAGDQRAGIVGDDDAEREGAVELVDRALDRGEQVAVVVAVDEVGDDLAVGFRSELVALPDQPLADALVILDDAVVHDRDPLVGKMRVGIGLRRLAVGRPAGMRDADVAGLLGRHARGELADLAERAEARQALVVDQRDAGRIVTAILEPTQTLDQQWSRLPTSYVPHDSAHVV